MHILYERDDRQPGDLPRAVVRAEKDDASALRNGLLENVFVHEATVRRDLFDRDMLHANGRQRLAAEMPPALVEDLSALREALLRKRSGEIAHRQPVTASKDVTRQSAEARSPAAQAGGRRRADGAGYGAIKQILGALQK